MNTCCLEISEEHLSAGVSNPKSNGYLCFERGPGSVFQAVMIQDVSGNLLKMFKNYNDLYCLHELLTSNRLNKEGPGTFHGKGLVLPGFNTPGVDVNLGSALSNLDSSANATALIAALKIVNPFTKTADFDPFNVHVFNQPDGRNFYQTIKYVDLDGVLLCNYCMKDSTDSDNAAEQKLSAWSLCFQNG